jgi:hypothetical protein
MLDFSIKPQVNPGRLESTLENELGFQYASILLEREVIDVLAI